MTGGLLFGSGCLGVSFSYFAPTCLRFASWFSDQEFQTSSPKIQFTGKVHAKMCTQNFSGNHEVLFTSLTPLWALSPSPFCSAPITFPGPLGTSQVLCRIHFTHTHFFLEHSSPYIHSANFHKTLSARRASSSFSHFQQTSSSFLLQCSSFLEDAVCKLLLKVALLFPQVPPHPLAILPTKKPHLLIFWDPSHWPVLSLVSLWLSTLGLQLSDTSWRYEDRCGP